MIFLLEKSNSFYFISELSMTNIVRYQFSDLISRDNTIEKYRTQSAVRKYASFLISVKESKIDSFID